MTDKMRRRECLVQGGHLALGLALSPLVGYTRRATPQQSGEPLLAIRLSTLITYLEDHSPKWMHEALVPGLSITIIEDAKVAWRRAATSGMMRSAGAWRARTIRLGSQPTTKNLHRNPWRDTVRQERCSPRRQTTRNSLSKSSTQSRAMRIDSTKPALTKCCARM